MAAQREVIKAGLDHMVHQLGLVTKLAAVEQMMAEQRPGLMDTKR